MANNLNEVNITFPQLLAFGGALLGTIYLIISDSREDLRHMNAETQNYIRQIIQKDQEDNEAFRKEIKFLYGTLCSHSAQLAEKKSSVN